MADFSLSKKAKYLDRVAERPERHDKTVEFTNPPPHISKPKPQPKQVERVERVERVEKAEKVEQVHEHEAQEPKYEKTIYTENEKEKLLIGYDLIQSEDWDSIPKGAHVRYETRKGEFRRGGFVVNTATVHNKPMIFIETLRGGKSGTEGYAKWPVAYEDISILWKKRVASDVKIINMNSKTDEIIGHVEELEKKIIRMEYSMEKLSNRLLEVTKFLSRKFSKPSVVHLGGKNTDTRYQDTSDF
jgi:hypothetical protein